MSPHDAILKQFRTDQLPPPLAEVAQRFHDLAQEMAQRFGYEDETGPGLRKLLEAQDCMIRAARALHADLDEQAYEARQEAEQALADARADSLEDLNPYEY